MNVRRLTLLILILILLLLAPAAMASITGTVVDEDGKAIGGATIRVYTAETSRAVRKRLISGHPEREPLLTATANDDGTFSVETKGDAAVDLVVESPGKRRHTIALTDKQELGPVLLREPSNRSVKVTAEGKPVTNVLVAFTQNLFVRTDQGGAFNTADESSATFIHPDYAIEQVFITDVAEVKLQKGVVVRGRIVDASGPVAHATVTINGWPLAESGDDGTFTIAHAPTGWRSVQAFAGAGAGIAIRSGAPAVEIRLRRGAVLSGAVRDTVSGDAVPGTRVTVSAGDERRDEMVVAGAKGNYAFDPLPSGSYRINGQHPAFAFDAASFALTESTSRTLGARPYARIRGRVLDESRKPVAGAWVAGVGVDGPKRTIADSGGNFLLRLPAEQRLVRAVAMKRGYAAGFSPGWTLKPGQTMNDVFITIPKGFPLQVRVVDRNRRPVAGVRVGLSLRDDTIASPAACDEPARETCSLTGASGVVTYLVVEGDYWLSARGEESKIVPLNREATLTARSSPFTLDVDYGATLTGKVVFADGTPAPGAEISVNAGNIRQQTTAGADGAFTIETLPPTRVSLVASTADRRITSAPVDVTPPAQSVVLTLPRGGRIEGRVADRATQRPVTDFTIAPGRRGGGMTAPPPPQPVHSDDGVFVLDNIAPGSVTLSVTAAGYVAASRADIAVEEGATVTGIDVQLDRGARLTGRVTASGKALSGVMVGIAANFGVPQTRASTDGDGEYVLDGVSAGERSIEFRKQGFVTRRKSIELTAAKDSRMDMDLDRGRELRGRVVDSAGAGIAGAAVAVQPATYGPDDSRAVSEGDGSFVIEGLSESRYNVTARKTGLVTATARDVEVPPPAPLTLTLKSGATIIGRVTGVQERELAGVYVNAYNGQSGSSAQTDASGAFTLRGIPDGQVTVTATINGASDRHSQPKVITVENGSAPPVQIDFAEGFTIRGKVSFNGVPVSNGSLNFVPTQNDPSRPFAYGRVTNGNYEVSGLGSGEYRIMLNSMEGRYDAKYEVTGSGTYDIEVRGANVRGRVIDASSGAPVANASVAIRGKTPLSSRGGTSDSDGRFMLAAVPDGTYDITVLQAPYAPAAKEVVVAGGSAPEVEVKLEGGTAVVIRIVDAVTGKSLSMANANVADAHGAFINGGAQRDDEGIRLWLQPGHYTLNAFSMGYVAQQKIELNVPTPDVRIALQRAGRVVFQATAAHRVRLMAPGASKPAYSGSAAPGAGASAENLAPGAYILQILGKGDVVEKSIPVNVIAGETVTVPLD